MKNFLIASLNLLTIVEARWDIKGPIGWYKDNRSGLRTWDRRIDGVGKYDCSSACEGFKYFSLQDGDVCFCESNWNDIARKGRRSNCGLRGDDWCNAVYEHWDGEALRREEEKKREALRREEEVKREALRREEERRREAIRREEEIKRLEALRKA